MCAMNAKLISDQEILNFLAEANKISFKWSNLLFGKKHFKFLCKFWKNSENIKSLIPNEKIEEWEKDVLVLNNIFQIESFMFEKYKKFITYAISRLVKKSKSYYMHNDFINEAYIVFKKCVWHYTKNNIKFTTYLFKAISSKVQQIKYKQKNCKLNINFVSDNEKIINTSYSSNEDLILDENFSFEKLICNCNLTKKEIKALQLRFKFGRKWVIEAKEIIFKSNGKGYSSYGLRVILEKAIKKLQVKYKEKSFSLSA